MGQGKSNYKLVENDDIQVIPSTSTGCCMHSKPKKAKKRKNQQKTEAFMTVRNQQHPGNDIASKKACEEKSLTDKSLEKDLVLDEFKNDEDDGR